MEKMSREAYLPTFLLVAAWQANEIGTGNVPLYLIYLDFSLDLPERDYFGK